MAPKPATWVWLVLRGAARHVAIGAALGVGLALATSRIIASALFGITAADVPTYIGVLLAALPLVMAAALIPALRASRLDPAMVLRDV